MSLIIAQKLEPALLAPIQQTRLIHGLIDGLHIKDIEPVLLSENPTTVVAAVPAVESPANPDDQNTEDRQQGQPNRRGFTELRPQRATLLLLGNNHRGLRLEGNNIDLINKAAKRTNGHG